MNWIAGLLRALWIPATALALAWAFSFTALYQRLDVLALDAQARLAASPRYFADTLVIDIDDVSLRAMQPYFGGWPYRRSTYALLIDYLGEMGARTVVFDILFADAREGDDAMSDAIARSPGVVLAGTATRDAALREQSAALLPALAWPVPRALSAPDWPAVQLPLQRFVQTARGNTRVGVPTVVAESDGVLRRLPLFDRFGAEVLPTLPLAAHFPNGAAPNVQRLPGGLLQVGHYRWATDAAGFAHLYFPRNANSVLRMPFSTVAAAMLGLPGKRLDPALLRGKTVFVGSSAFFSDRVLTPLGEMNGLEVLAISHELLAHDLVLTPRQPQWSALLLLLALTPALSLLRWPYRSALIGAGASVGAMALVYGAHLSLLHWGQQESSLLFPLLAVGFASLLETIAALRRRDAEQAKRIHVLAHDDPLTRLPNRFSLQAQLALAIETARLAKHRLAVMLIDLDQFKTINDTLGHDTGDQMLVEAAARLRASMRASDVVARLGGDEFGVVMSGVDEATTIQCAEKALGTLAQPYRLAGQELYVTSSVGISMYPVDGADVATLLKNADTALYGAKAARRNSYRFFTPDLSQAAMDRLQIENQLRQGLARNELELYFQPQIDLASGQIVAAEALLRWNHPVMGVLPPSQFISIAEQSNLILGLGEWALRAACSQLQAWHAKGFHGVERVAVNLSARQFDQPSLVAQIANILRETRLPASRLELEITESVAMRDPEHSLDVLQVLKKMGIALALDDFGTGHSSLTYLKSFPIDTLKIDGSFVRDIETDRHDAEICASTIDLARKLGLEVVAEGVETQCQFDFLKQRHCNKAQGYLIGRPLPAAALEAALCATGCA